MVTRGPGDQKYASAASSACGQFVLRWTIWFFGLCAKVSKFGRKLAKWVKLARNVRSVLCTAWTILFPTVQWLDCAVSNYPIVRQFCVQLSNGLTVLCPTVQWSDSAV